MNFFFILEEAAKKWPDDIAMVHNGRCLRYSDLGSAAESLGTGFRQAGIRQGDKVGLLCPSSPEYIVAFFAALRVGGIVLPISPALKAPEVALVAKKMSVDAFCYSAEFRQLIPERDEGVSVEAPVFSGREPLFIKLAALRDTPPDDRDRLIEINAAEIRFSSGTTSNAKGILVSHASLMKRVEAMLEAPPIMENDSILWPHSMAWGLATIAGYLLRGAKIVMADAMKTERLSRVFAQERIALVQATPLFYGSILNEESITTADLAGVKYFMSGGASVTNSIADAFRGRFGREIIQHYGSGECGRVLTHLSDDVRKRGSVGIPVPGFEAKLDSGGLNWTGGGEMGELCVRGPGMFDAYYKPWRLRDEVLEDGWFRTGDLARRDADGYYWIVGRVKDVINVDGAKVYPRELEEVLLMHPGVEEAVVYGALDARFGEAPHAKVKLRSGMKCTERELLRHVNDKVSVFKSLRGVEFVEEIPKTVTGKSKRIG